MGGAEFPREVALLVGTVGIVGREWTASGLAMTPNWACRDFHVAMLDEHGSKDMGGVEVLDRGEDSACGFVAHADRRRSMITGKRGRRE